VEAHHPPRDLTAQELAVLRDIRVLWGPQNQRSDVFFTDEDEAVIFVRDRSGSLPVCAVLTNLARFLAEGSYSPHEYRRSIMGPLTANRTRMSTRLIYCAAQLRGYVLGWHRDA
jgi:hypothetical protein